MRRADYQPSPDSRKCLGVLIYRQRRFLLLSTALPVLDSAQQKALRFNRSGELFACSGSGVQRRSRRRAAGRVELKNVHTAS